MPHMLAQEHMGIVNPLQYSPYTRTYATLSAALAAIGSAAATLLIANDGDGVWTINSNITFPSNVCLWIAPGAILAGTGNITVQGQLFAHTNPWYSGSGIQTLSFAVIFVGAIEAQRIGLNTVPNASVQLHLNGDASLPAALRLEERTAGAGGNAIQWYSNGVSRGVMGLPGTQNVTLTLSNSANFIVSGGNTGLGMVPTVQLELSTGGAQKSTGTTWSNPSSERLKKLIRPYTEGIALLKRLRPVRYFLNGRGGLEADAQEHVGIIGEEVQHVAPQMVRMTPMRLDPEDPEDTVLPVFQGGDDVLWALVNAVKELDARLARMEALAVPRGQAA